MGVRGVPPGAGMSGGQFSTMGWRNLAANMPMGTTDPNYVGVGMGAMVGPCVYI